jgi:predicted Fe-Mo cluster-binding NifX family protein
MKVAIPRYEGRISPRFGFMEDILLVEIERERILSREIIPVERYLPIEIPEILVQKGVGVVLTGGINLQFQEMFRERGIEVIWGLIGTPEEALEAFCMGRIATDMGRLKGRKRKRFRGGPFWI